MEENITNVEAIRQQNVCKAKFIRVKLKDAELNLKEKEGKLVRKDVVYKQLFEFGKHLQNALLSIPDRITDEIIAQKGDRAKVRSILCNAIEKELEILSNISKEYS